ncbi:unnamed protein product [Paramecium primaurelia]|uniref:Transmembrane protein n=1 Tax=Paramecium primaurelia TaxID=5886 RepID=A0A8S1PGC8_PARPR|nr:unnamed protein product [Paramecium primaurelia]
MIASLRFQISSFYLINLMIIIKESIGSQYGLKLLIILSCLFILQILSLSSFLILYYKILLEEQNTFQKILNYCLKNSKSIVVHAVSTSNSHIQNLLNHLMNYYSEF